MRAGTMLNFLSSMQMFIVGGRNNVFATEIGDVEKDDEGVQSLKTLGENMALLLEMMQAYRSK